MASTNLRNIQSTLTKIDPILAKVITPWILSNPKKIPAFAYLYRAYKHGLDKRKELDANDIKIPPFLIISITRKCNLRCAGCYAVNVGTVPKKIINSPMGCNSDNSDHLLLSLDQWRKVLQDATDLGIFGFIIAGGEPFMFTGLLDLMREFQNAFFIIFTNGTLINSSKIEELAHIPNIAVVVSIEGDQKINDARRGFGIYEKASKTLQELTKRHILTGISVTITQLNLKYWMDPLNLTRFMKMGVRCGFFLEYIPSNYEITSACCNSEKCVKSFNALLSLDPSPDLLRKIYSGNEDILMLTPEQRKIFRSFILTIRQTKRFYIIHSPGDEELVGGCISAGRGFAHITPSGDVTACPVSNLATHNVTTDTLYNALASPFFQKIRENAHLLETGDTPCALFAHPKELELLARSIGAYKTT